MGKKTRKNRFNKTVDVDVVYSSNTIAEVDPTDNLAELNLTKERAEELQKIRAKLPSFTQSNSLETELAKLPLDKPFRAFVHNMAFSATEADVAKFFEPLEVTNINLVGGESGSRGFCFVDFATRDDLAKALEKNDTPLAGRPVNVRIADPNTNQRGGSGFAWDRSASGGIRRSETSHGKRGGYRPAALDRDELSESSGPMEWRRNATIISNRPSPRSYGYNRPSETHASVGGAWSNARVERPKVNILPRTAPVIPSSEDVPRDPKIFGHAKPVDTASKDRVIGERLSQATADTH